MHSVPQPAVHPTVSQRWLRVRVSRLTCPAMNCPNPGGKVRVEISRVTMAGYTSRLTGREGL